MLKIAIVGCGKIADSHAAQIKRIDGCQIVGVCDREELMAKQLAERFSAGKPFAELDRLLGEAKPDVVHITTPPQSHFDLARRCLEKGCHVYIEKPFTLNTRDAEVLIQVAEQKQRKITVGHDDQFRHVARRMRKLIGNGFLGGAPVHMESYYCYEFANSDYATALIGDKEHWVRKLPGGLLQNIISHGIARIAEFLTTPDPEIVSVGFVSPLLRKAGEKQIVDELRVIVREHSGATAYFTFSSQMRPSLHQFRIFGPTNGLLLDQDNETLIKLNGKRHKSYLEQFLPPVALAMQCIGNIMHNAKLFARSDFHSKAGMKYLIESFYRSIKHDSPVPIPYREILLTSRIMDTIFKQVSTVGEGASY